MKPLQKEVRSFKYAFNGIVGAIKSELHIKFHVLAAVLVIVCGFVFDVSSLEWCVLLLCIGAVFSAELINTAIEKWLDYSHPKQHKTVGFVKDVAAGAVLVLSIISACIAGIIFIPKL